MTNLSIKLSLAIGTISGWDKYTPPIINLMRRYKSNEAMPLNKNDVKFFILKKILNTTMIARNRIPVSFVKNENNNKIDIMSNLFALLFF